MKKIVLVAALVAAFAFGASAQQKTAVKSKDATIASVNKAQAAADNVKKAAKYATWMKLGQTYLEAYEAPQGPAWVGAGKTEVDLLMGNVKTIRKKATVEVSGQQMTCYFYPNCNYYFNESNALAIIEITEPYVEGALEKSLEAYKKAAELDASGSKSKDIAAAIKQISQHYVEEAYNAYGFGKSAEAAVKFVSAYESALVAPCSEVDTSSLFNAAVSYCMIENFAAAKPLFEKCVEYGYEYKGEVYGKLSEIAKSEGDEALAKEWLEKGFVKFPENQGILVGLINFYLNSGENTERLFELLNVAKKNEPGNASLWYVEGNIYNQLGREEEAVKSYRQCVEVDPNYVYGYIGEGLLHYKKASDIADKAATEMDDAKYMAMVKQFNDEMKICIEPFETAFNKTEDTELKVSLADYLKSCYYRFVSDGDEYKAAYDKYNKIVKEGL